MTSPLRLIFMGSPDFSVPVLSALLDAGHEVVCVYAQPPRPAGRGQKERPCPVHAYAVSRGIPVRTPENLKSDDDAVAFADLEADLAVVVAYGLILPQAVLDAPRLGCINVHASLLPRWRGAAPIQRAIQAGDAETGITIMQMDAGLDTGAMLIEQRTPITAETTAESLHDDLAAMGATLIVDAVGRLAAGTRVATPQPDEGVTYAAKLNKTESRIDWGQSAEVLERTVRALNPWPGLWFEMTRDGKTQRIKVLAAECVEGMNAGGEVGRVLDDRLSIACADGVLRPTRLQRAGKGPAATEDFLRGFSIPAGTVLDADNGEDAP